MMRMNVTTSAIGVRRACGLLVLLAAWLFGSVAWATQKGDQVEVVFHGTLKRKPCHISNDQPIYVHFGKVGINKVDGVRYQQTIPYTLRCEESDPGLTLSMTVRGAVTGYDTAALNTSATGLGIRILHNGQPMSINKPLTIDYRSPPALSAVPVQQPGSRLQEGDFSATATLMAVYE